MEYLWHFPSDSWPGTHLALAREQLAQALAALGRLKVSRLEDAGLHEAIMYSQEEQKKGPRSQPSDC